MHSVETIINCGDEQDILVCARISSDQANRDPGLLGYLIRQNHWSPFQMISANVQVVTTRDIGRQALRHLSAIGFQELSGRYAPNEDLHYEREFRLKGKTNRQGSRYPETTEEEIKVRHYRERATRLAMMCKELHDEMVADEIASECARAILPEGYVPTHMCLNFSARTWIHYLKERLKLDPDGVPYAQREHFWLAQSVEKELRHRWPLVFRALDAIDYLT